MIVWFDRPNESRPSVVTDNECISYFTFLSTLRFPLLLSFAFIPCELLLILNLLNNQIVL